MSKEVAPAFQFIASQRSYEQALETVNSVVDTKAELPRLVFRHIRHSGWKYSFIVFDWLLYRDFWTASAVLREGCARDGARLVLTMLETTVPADSIPPAFTIDPIASAMDYESATETPICPTLDGEIPYSIAMFSKKIAITPTDASWMLYGIRRDEIGILAHRELEAHQLGPMWLTAEDALETYGLYHRCKQPDGEQFKRLFLLNYSK